MNNNNGKQIFDFELMLLSCVVCINTNSGEKNILCHIQKNIREGYCHSQHQRQHNSSCFFFNNSIFVDNSISDEIRMFAWNSLELMSSLDMPTPTENETGPVLIMYASARADLCACRNAKAGGWGVEKSHAHFAS